jgi:L-threonylcarbamoyladenylate synthase
VTVPSRFPADQISGEEIAGWLGRGAVVVLPTETVYGLAILPGKPSLARRVFELKGRPSDLNLPVLIGALDQLTGLGVDFNRTAQELAKAFWPGPLTIVMGFAPGSARPSWLEGRVEVAIRLPGFKLLRDVALAAGPLLVTSANGHGTGPKRVASEAAESLHGPVDLIVDGGTLSSLPSTIINTRWSPPQIERVGAIAPAEIEALIGEIRMEVK